MQRLYNDSVTHQTSNFADTAHHDQTARLHHPRHHQHTDFTRFYLGHAFRLVSNALFRDRRWLENVGPPGGREHSAGTAADPNCIQAR